MEFPARMLAKRLFLSIDASHDSLGNLHETYNLSVNDYYRALVADGMLWALGPATFPKPTLH